jgi:hypothetical protein
MVVRCFAAPSWLQVTAPAPMFSDMPTSLSSTSEKWVMRVPAPTVLFLTLGMRPQLYPGREHRIGPERPTWRCSTQSRHTAAILGTGSVSMAPKAYSLAEVALKALTTADI